MQDRLTSFAEENIQLAKTCFSQLDVINVYRSQDEPLSRAASILQNFIDPEKDFNVCATQTNVLTNSLEMAGFHQHVTLPTHVKGGAFNVLIAALAA